MTAYIAQAIAHIIAAAVIIGWLGGEITHWNN